MQIKTTVKYHLTFVRMAVIKSQKITSVGEKWRKGNPCELLVEMEIGAPTMEKSMEVPQKIKHRNTIWSTKIHQYNFWVYIQR